MTGWRLAPLTEEDGNNLAPHVSEAYRLDLAASGNNPVVALEHALEEPGQAWAVLDVEDASHVLGAFGWTEAGSIWSMWRLLTRTESKELLKLAPRFIAALVQDAGRQLGNIVWEGNGEVIRWLEATECFTLLVDRGLTYEDRRFIPFVTKPHLTRSPPSV